MRAVSSHGSHTDSGQPSVPEGELDFELGFPRGNLKDSRLQKAARLGEEYRLGSGAVLWGKKEGMTSGSHLCWDDSKPSLFLLRGTARKENTKGHAYLTCSL